MSVKVSCQRTLDDSISPQRIISLMAVKVLRTLKYDSNCVKIYGTKLKQTPRYEQILNNMLYPSNRT